MNEGRYSQTCSDGIVSGQLYLCTGHFYTGSVPI
jgi:hypothetical protein